MEEWGLMMSDIWFSGDWHLDHKMICQYSNRPFSSVEEMNLTLIENYNKLVKPNDEVYLLGDFSFSNPLQFTKRMNGRLHLIKGNHDYRQHVVGAFEWVKDVHMIKGLEFPIFLSHYSHRSWPQRNYKSIHLYAHSHGTLPDYGRSMDVGVDAVSFKYHPINLNEVFDIMKNRSIEYNGEINV